jgi:hypothetical protein
MLYLSYGYRQIKSVIAAQEKLKFLSNLAARKS